MAILFAATRFRATDKANEPIAGAFLAFYATGTSTFQSIYVDAALTTVLTNPVKADANGLFPEIWLDDSLPAYKVVHSSPDINDPSQPGSIIWTIPQYNNTFSIDKLSQPILQLIYPVSHAESVAGIVPLSLAYPADPIGDARRYCLLTLDGSTDNTTSISSMWALLANYRGPVTIPYNCKFNKATVYSTIPVGVILHDQSSVNTGQPPGYKNKRLSIVSNDTASDDTVVEIQSSHHPAIRLNNLYTSGSSSATSRYHSILYASGYRWTNDPIDGLQHLIGLSTRVSPPSYLWRFSWVKNTCAQGAILSSHWKGATSYPNGSVVDTTDGNIWINNGGTGTSAATEPTGTGPTLNDGGITWTWVAPWNAGATLFFVDEDGYGGITGLTGRWGVDGPTRKGPSLNINDTTHDAFIRDDQRAQDFWRISDAAGLRHGGIRSLNYAGTISGATPSISGELHTVNNGGATNMTNLVLPGSQTSGFVILYFSNGNTTVKASGFNLKGGIDVTPTAGNMMTLFKEPSIGGSWTEISRNF